MGWGGDDNVQVRSKTDLRILKTRVFCWRCHSGTVVLRTTQTAAGTTETESAGTTESESAGTTEALPLLHPCRSARRRPAHIEEGVQWVLLPMACIHLFATLLARPPFLFQVAFFLCSFFCSFPVLLWSATCWPSSETSEQRCCRLACPPRKVLNTASNSLSFTPSCSCGAASVFGWPLFSGFAPTSGGEPMLWLCKPLESPRSCAHLLAAMGEKPWAETSCWSSVSSTSIRTVLDYSSPLLIHDTAPTYPGFLPFQITPLQQKDEQSWSHHSESRAKIQPTIHHNSTRCKGRLLQEWFQPTGVVDHTSLRLLGW